MCIMPAYMHAGLPGRSAPYMGGRDHLLKNKVYYYYYVLSNVACPIREY